MNKRIIETLKERGKNQGWLALRMGISQANLSQKLSDQRRLTLKEAKAISRILEISLDYITGVSNDPDPNLGPVRFHAYWVSEIDENKIALLVTEVNGGSTVVFDANRHKWESPEEEKKAEVEMEKIIKSRYEVKE
jgi:transcriptional regulator with XRE-family HTH domain